MLGELYGCGNTVRLTGGQSEARRERAEAQGSCGAQGGQPKEKREIWASAASNPVSNTWVGAHFAVKISAHESHS